MSDRPLGVIAPVPSGADPVWSRLRHDATALAASEPVLASFVNATILGHVRLEQALTYHLAQKLGNADVGSLQVHEVFEQAYRASSELGDAARADLIAIFERDPAVSTFAEPFLFFKGYHSLQAYRVTHWPCTSRAGSRRSSPSTSIPRPGSVEAS